MGMGDADRFGAGGRFRIFWLGQSVSMCGTQVTALALPSAAIILLGAGAFQAGLLVTLQMLSFPLLGLLVGVAADRWPRRRILIAADLVRLGALASIPLAFAAGVLTLGQVYLVALVFGVGTVFFLITYHSYLPELVAHAELRTANSRLQSSESVAQFVGPALGGFLIQAIGAALAIAVDVASYVVSVGSLLLLGGADRVAPQPSRAARLPSQIADGVRAVAGEPILRSLSVCTALLSFGLAIREAVFLVYCYRQLHLPAALVGSIFAIGSLGAIGGALIAARLAGRLGVGRVLGISTGLGALSLLLAPVALLGAPFVVLAGLQLVLSTQRPIYNVNSVSLAQAAMPEHLRGRITATMSTIGWGALPLGGLVGAAFGSQVGVAQALILSGVATLIGSASLRLGPILELRSAPAPASLG